MKRKPVRRALISVHDKTGLIEIGQLLSEMKVEIVSTGSTAQHLRDAGILVAEVGEYTGFPEILGGRVKTLHPKIHAGILANQDNSEHLATLSDLDITPFDLLIVNLYPFLKTILSGATYEESIEQIDIGGPSMLRGAAKNHRSMAVLTSPNQYAEALAALRSGGFTDEERKNLALAAFRISAEYDLTISSWLGSTISQEIPDWFGLIWKQESELRYGENPHQRAALYRGGPAGIVDAIQLHGKEMSFNNYTDADAAWRAALDHVEPAVAIIKHANPCGIAIASDISEAYRKALECDPISAYGGVVAVNRAVSAAMAEQISSVFTEVIIAPEYEAAALELLKKKPSLRILESKVVGISPLEIRPISGGVLLQERDRITAEGDHSDNWRQVTGKPVGRDEMADLQFAWRSLRAVRSNAIVLAHNGAAIGIGMGQVNRVDAARLAVARAGERAAGSVAASDAFFPFPDGVEILAQAGVRAIVQPGGSVRDQEVIEAAAKAGIAMFLTGTRHFSHA